MLYYFEENRKGFEEIAPDCGEKIIELKENAFELIETVSEYNYKASILPRMQNGFYSCIRGYIFFDLE